MIDNWRWAGVPFYLRTGKRLPARHTEVAVQFKRAPLVLFRDTPVNSLNANQLIIHISPDEGISLRFGAKIPGAQMKVGEVEMDFNYADYFGTTANTGYEVLLYDGIMGDQTLYQRADMVEAGWTVVDPIIDVWKALAARNFPNYAAGSWGPEEATDIIARDGDELVLAATGLETTVAPNDQLCVSRALGLGHCPQAITTCSSRSLSTP